MAVIAYCVLNCDGPCPELKVCANRQVVLDPFPAVAITSFCHADVNTSGTGGAGASETVHRTGESSVVDTLFHEK